MLELKVLDGYVDYVGNDAKWMMRGIGGHAVSEQYSKEGLIQWSRLIGHDPLNITIDNDKTIRFSLEDSNVIKKDLLAIIDELENIQDVKG